MLAAVHGDRAIRPSSNNGYSLLEVMVAFTILTVSILGILPVTAFMLKQNTNNAHFAQARYIMEQYSEFIRSVDYDDVMLTDDGDTTDLFNIITPDRCDSNTMYGQKYYVRLNIAQNVPVTDVKTINITITWKDPSSNASEKISALTYKAAVSR